MVRISLLDLSFLTVDTAPYQQVNTSSIYGLSDFAVLSPFNRHKKINT